ncbi:hypothetical protein [Thermoplasma sp. Kam2015]|uniref:hypothetical protein n=1 Tax=Thermoplasma sp. Kam2015 TaxID=2094122 RepID=UPI00191C883E|nr:hypothetical protein [Thermoplasma sp. Kam2015]
MDIEITIKVSKKTYERLERLFYLALLPKNFQEFQKEIRKENVPKRESEKDRFRKIEIK